VRGIALGCYYRDEVPTRLLQVIDGIAEAGVAFRWQRDRLSRRSSLFLTD